MNMFMIMIFLFYLALIRFRMSDHCSLRTLFCLSFKESTGAQQPYF